jgi:hypothetical protein
MTDIWIVLVEDRHTDVDALPFTSEVAALQAARAEAEANARDPQDVSEGELTQTAIRDGWVLLLEYGTESDCVRVIKRQLEADPE